MPPNPARMSAASRSPRRQARCFPLLADLGLQLRDHFRLSARPLRRLVAGPRITLRRLQLEQPLLQLLALELPLAHALLSLRLALALPSRLGRLLCLLQRFPRVGQLPLPFLE